MLHTEILSRTKKSTNIISSLVCRAQWSGKLPEPHGMSSWKESFSSSCHWGFSLSLRGKWRRLWLFSSSWDPLPPTGLPHPALIRLCLVLLNLIMPCSFDVLGGLHFSGGRWRSSGSGRRCVCVNCKEWRNGRLWSPCIVWENEKRKTVSSEARGSV